MSVIEKMHPHTDQKQERNSAGIIPAHWKLIPNSPKPIKIFTEPIVVATKQPNNKMNSLVRAELA